MRAKRSDLRGKKGTVGLIEAHEDIGVEFGLVLLLGSVDADVLSSGGHGDSAN